MWPCIIELHDSLKVSSVCSCCAHLFLELIKKIFCTTHFSLFACTDLKINPTAFYTRFHFIVMLPIPPRDAFTLTGYCARHFPSSLWKDSKQGQINVEGRHFLQQSGFRFSTFKAPVAQSTAVIMPV